MKNFDNSPLSFDAERALYRAIRALPVRFQTRCMACGHGYEVSSVVVYSQCPECGRQAKHRSFGGGGEVQDILLMALQWWATAGIKIPAEFQEFIDADWTDRDEYYSPEE